MSRAIAAIMALAVLASGGVYAMDAALETAGSHETVENESWTVDIGNATELADSNIEGAYYDDTVTVRNNTDDIMTEGVDYEWLRHNGTVKALSGGNLTDGNTANITYGYDETTQEQRRLAGLAGQIPRLLGLMFPLFAVFIFLALLSR